MKPVFLCKSKSNAFSCRSGRLPGVQADWELHAGDSLFQYGEVQKGRIPMFFVDRFTWAHCTRSAFQSALQSDLPPSEGGNFGTCCSFWSLFCFGAHSWSDCYNSKVGSDCTERKCFGIMLFFHALTLNDTRSPLKARR